LGSADRRFTSIIYGERFFSDWSLLVLVGFFQWNAIVPSGFICALMIIAAAGIYANDEHKKET
jgi:hypothetical protein